MVYVDYFINDGSVMRLQSVEQAAGATACNVWCNPSALVVTSLL
jgi:hypothetical protein